ncbi:MULTISPECIES: nuclear transport factor 2 family protein [Acinetobacter]|nr:nuclear transport factor 2 family protein [Acinetobacter guerrae]
MDILTQLSIQALVTQRIQAFAQFNDAGQLQALSDLFTDDAEYARPSQPNDFIQGKAQILASFQNRPIRKTRHMVSNILITDYSNDRVSVHSQIILFIADPDHPEQFNQMMVGGFNDELILQQGQWYFNKRAGYLDFKKNLI